MSSWEEPFEGGGRDALKFGSLGFIQDPLIVYGRGFVWILKKKTNKTKKETNIFCLALQLTVVVKKMKTFLNAGMFFGTVKENKVTVQTKQIETAFFFKRCSQTFTDSVWFPSNVGANGANLTVKRPVLQQEAALYIFMHFFVMFVPCVYHLTAAFAIIYGFCVLSGRGRLFQAPVHELTTAYENRWRAQSTAYLLYQAEINAATTGQWVMAAVVMHILCSLFHSVSDRISENAD